MCGKALPFRQHDKRYWGLSPFNFEAQPRELVNDPHGKAKPYRTSGGIAARQTHFFFGFSVFGFGGGPKSPYAINPEREASSLPPSRPAQTSSLVSFAVLISYSLPVSLPLVISVISPCKSVRQTFALPAFRRSRTVWAGCP